MEFKGLRQEYDVLKEKINNHLLQVLETGDFILGRDVIQLEEKLADYVGVKSCLTCGNATDALILALMAIDLQRNDVVFVPDFSFIATASCVALLGGMPIFVDVDIDTYNMSPESLRKAIIEAKALGLNCKAIITVDLFGQPADYKSISTIAEQYNLKIIEDGAQAMGGSINNQRSCSFGDISITSFFPAKPFGAYGDGGALFLNNDSLIDKIWSLRSHGRSRTDKYENVILGFNSRLDTIQAAILLEKIEYFAKHELEVVDKIAKLYSSRIQKYVKVPYIKEGNKSSWSQYTIALKDKSERDEIQSYLQKQNVPTAIYYPKPLHEQKALCQSLKIVDLSNSKKASETVLSLPIHAFLSDEEIDYVIECVTSFFEL